MIKINEISYSILRGGLWVALAVLCCALMFLLAYDAADVNTYNNRDTAIMLTKLLPLLAMECLIPAVYLEMQARQTR